ncbi:S-norcoclaurine synthase 1-like isoform X2 [Dendrobium catenatum]|uniref:S-norcoclaurine synthase 1-like isoform X2 n=1 Tax=Dendrobium catenatum TaxID=906689 RepID=UPI00109FB508|nr:S-norcoclaurine synthase 1-like isoform X2 [Dendrobium catenatum]
MEEKFGFGRFGGSFKVDSVQALAANLGPEIPDIYVRPERKEDIVAGGKEDSGESFPVIDFGRLFDSKCSEEEAAKLHSACQGWGFFQGLQIRRKGKWLPVQVIPGAFIVNIGDIIEILCNGKYKSIVHRAVVNNEKERLSVAGFHSLNIGDLVGPIAEIVKGDELLYKSLQFEEYFKQVLASKLEGKTIIDHMKLDK